MAFPSSYFFYRHADNIDINCAEIQSLGISGSPHRTKHNINLKTVQNIIVFSKYVLSVVDMNIKIAIENKAK